MKIASKKTGVKKTPPKGGEQQDHSEIKTDFPLSEKDEVKKAEEKLREGTEAKKRL